MHLRYLHDRTSGINHILDDVGTDADTQEREGFYRMSDNSGLKLSKQKPCQERT